MNILFLIITFVTSIITTIKLSIIHTISYIVSLFHEKKRISKVKWANNIQDIYYTYSKDEYDRKSFKPFLFQRHFFK